jgi:bacillithiol system protein YtxJ
MQWSVLTREEQLDALLRQSFIRPQLIYKHSTRCGVSDMVKTRLEKAKAPDTIDFHFLDLIAYRSLSNQVAEKFHVHHESPQVLLIKNGECIFDESHIAVRMEDIAEQAAW